ncbi:beta-ketoacyl-ACP synthase [Oceanobacter mangrovi]|uniref:beta-ketoacyl-ACP synthase n=1 Tax=Oceanobacter mangrovi TaxID=2862510 RepID=UPI001C8E847B|nr:beta-ketoacyl-ACP synthase [Oceanobacter mangrovi]
MADVPVYLNQLGMVCSLGHSPEQIWQTLQDPNAQPLTRSSQWSPQPVYVGQVHEPLCSLESLPEHQRSRNNQLLFSAFEQIRAQFEQASQHIAPERIGIVLGSSTSGIAEAGDTVANWLDHGIHASTSRYSIQEISAPALSLAQLVNACGPRLVISTACSSGAKALASARRMLQQDVCDLVIAGGVDSLAAMTIQGFGSLESLSADLCNPSGASRNGINIGEGAALFLMSREPGPVILAGAGESSDAHHISAPHPEGLGAIAAMQQALQQRQIKAAEVDYINLHGTATPQNDQMEARAVHQLFGAQLPVSSTKRLTGHTLGAAGAIEAGLCWLTLQQQGELPPHRWNGDADASLAPIQLAESGSWLPQPPRFVLSNSFAFGGNNISLLLERASHD